MILEYGSRNRNHSLLSPFGPAGPDDSLLVLLDPLNKNNENKYLSADTTWIVPDHLPWFNQ